MMPDPADGAPKVGEAHIREVERVDDEIILVTLEAHGRTYRTVVRKEAEPGVRYSDEAFDHLYIQLRAKARP